MPPSRPSSSQLCVIRTALASISRNSTVGVLGATPEFRDLLFQEGFHSVVVFEQSDVSYVEMTKLRVHESAEELVQGDWRDTLSHWRGRLAVVLSHLTSGNIPYEDRDNFYKDVIDCLVPGGLFIDYVLMHEQSNLQPVELVVDAFRTAAFNLLEINRFNCKVLFNSDLLKNEVLDTSAFYDVLMEHFDDQRIRRFIEANTLITPRGGVWWYGRDWAQVASSYACGLSPISCAADPPESPYHGIGYLKVYRPWDGI